MANKDDQKKFRQSQKEKGLVELRGIWVKKNNREQIREIINSALVRYYRYYSKL